MLMSVHLFLYLDHTATTLEVGDIQLGLPQRTVQGTLLGNLLPEECHCLSVPDYL